MSILLTDGAGVNKPTSGTGFILPGCACLMAAGAGTGAETAS
jgi:hypothetical protein